MDLSMYSFGAGLGPGRVVLGRVEPPEDEGVTARPQHPVLVELEVVRAVAGVDQVELLRLRVPVPQLALVGAAGDAYIPSCGSCLTVRKNASAETSARFGSIAPFATVAISRP